MINASPSESWIPIRYGFTIASHSFAVRSASTLAPARNALTNRGRANLRLLLLMDPWQPANLTNSSRDSCSIIMQAGRDHVVSAGPVELAGVALPCHGIVHKMGIGLANGDFGFRRSGTQ